MISFGIKINKIKLVDYTRRSGLFFLILVFYFTLYIPALTPVVDAMNANREINTSKVAAEDVPKQEPTFTETSKVENSAKSTANIIDPLTVPKDEFLKANPVAAANENIDAILEEQKAKQADIARQQADGTYTPEEQQEDSAEAPEVDTSKEVVAERTLDSYTYKAEDGSEVTRSYAGIVNYPKGGGDAALADGKLEGAELVPVQGDLEQDTAYDKANKSKKFIFFEDKSKSKKSVKQDDGFIEQNFFKLGDENTIKIKADDGDGTAITFTPLDVDNKVNPSLVTDDVLGEVVKYYDAWNGIDLTYLQSGTQFKEYIIVKNKKVKTELSFKTLGGMFSVDPANPKALIFTADNGNVMKIPEITVQGKASGTMSFPKVDYIIEGNVLKVKIDPTWLSEVPDEEFPLYVDPTLDYYGGMGNIIGASGSAMQSAGAYMYSFKSDGYVCNNSNCPMNVGALNSGGAKAWRSAFAFNLSYNGGDQVIQARFHTTAIPGSLGYYNGYRGYHLTWANALNFNGFYAGGGIPWAYGGVNLGDDIDMTALAQWMQANNVSQGWMMMKAANEGDLASIKQFSTKTVDTYIQIWKRRANLSPVAPTGVSPVNNAVITAPRPRFDITPTADPDGDKIMYAYHVLDSKGNIIAHSGAIDVPFWTMPDDMLVDGETYQWRGHIAEVNPANWGQYYTGWTPTQNYTFKYDLRLGKDKTQTYDSVGPLSVSLNRGNGTSGISTHSMNALGGQIGLSLDYNTPGLSKNGLTASYYPTTDFNATPAITVTDRNVDMSWGSYSPYPGVINADNFSVRWKGFFIAPETGNYRFGGGVDDNLWVDVNNINVFHKPCCGWIEGTADVYMVKDQAYPISIAYQEGTGYAAAHVTYKAPSAATFSIIPSNLFRTEVDFKDTDYDGLNAKFYKNYDVSTNPNSEINASTPLVFSTKVPTVNINWQSNTLVPGDVGVMADYMMARYTGYLTIPTSGTYNFTTQADDGTRLTVGNEMLINDWNGGAVHNMTSPNRTFTAGQVVPIQLDYKEITGDASVALYWNGPAGNSIIPGDYLTSSVKSLPNGWRLGSDIDGSISYERIVVRPSGDVVLMDNDGFEHKYTAKAGGGFTPPKDENGYLIKNNDTSYTLNDSDGRAYNFSSEGLLTLVTNPTDDKQPGALKLEYRTSTTNGASYGSPKLYRIVDGVDPTRFGQVYFRGEAESSDVCNTESGFDNAPTGYLCAFKTSDGDTTTFQYKSGTLAGTFSPGGGRNNFGYDSYGRMTTYKDPLAIDAIAAGIIPNTDQSDYTITYDSLSRVSSVTTPDSFIGTVPEGQVNKRFKHLFEYGATTALRHVEGTPEPAGYLEKITFDELYRTTEDCNRMGLCSQTEYDQNKDIVFSSTSIDGLKSTTIYDNLDRPRESYGPAPSAWFGSDRKPLASYTNQTPKTTTNYDEGIVGPAVTWYDARNGSFFGAPKAHTTGILPANPNVFWQDFAGGANIPFTPASATDGFGFSATAKITFPQAGTYYISSFNNDGYRLTIDDVNVGDPSTDTWTRRNVGNTHYAAVKVPFVAEAGKAYRFKYDYVSTNNEQGYSSMMIRIQGPGIVDDGSGWGSNTSTINIVPDYGLMTSTVTLDPQVGNTTVNTNYGSTPELGIVKNTTENAGTASALTTSFEYEAQNAPGSYLRQTKKTLPGGNSYNYSYYSATESVDNPCTTANDPASQAGMQKSKSEPDPDGSGPTLARTTEFIYNASGDMVASRYNQDNWTCIIQDARGRTTNTNIPSYNGKPARVITNNFAVGGNPLITSSTDGSGTITAETDLSGRLIKYTDAKNNVTNYYYDSEGRLSKKTSAVGTETYTFDQYDRTVEQKLDNVTYSITSYDSLGRVSQVEYPQAKSGTQAALKQTGSRDSLERQASISYALPDGTTLTDSVTRSLTGVITGGTELGVTKTYSYDGSGRLTTATIGDNKFSYDYNQQTTSDCNQASANLLAYKNSNRTKFKHVTLNTDGSTKDVIKDSSYCYNNADQLIASTNDNALDSPTYDSHGNTLTLGSGVNQTSLTYDSSDRNIGVIEAGGAVTTTSTTNADGTVTTTTTTAPKKEVSYVRDLQNRLLSRVTKTNDIETSNSNYGYTASGDSPDFITDTNNNVVEKYLSLAGGVLLTIRPNTNASTSVELANISTYSLANIHGDIFATLDSNGALRNKTMTGAYGEKLSLPTGAALTSALANPNSLASKLTVSYVSGANTNIVTNGTNNNTVAEATNGYVGQHQKLTESNLAIGLIQMGARVYLPTIGRFLQVDPVEGGTDNNYVYVVDPVNSFDLNGQWGISNVKKFAKDHWRGIAQAAIMVATTVAVGVAVGALCGATAGVGCAVAVGFVVGASGGAAENAVGQAGNGKKFSWKSMGISAGIGGVLGGLQGGSLSQAFKAKVGSKLAKVANGTKSRVDLTKTRSIDLWGASHYVKSLGRFVKTPHVKDIIMGPQGPIGKSVREATYRDLYKAWRFLRK